MDLPPPEVHLRQRACDSPVLGIGAAGWACGAGRFATLGQFPPGSGRGGEGEADSAFYILHAAFPVRRGRRGRASLCVRMVQERRKRGTRMRWARVACDKPAITRSADSLACGLAGRDKPPPGYWKQFARHGQAFYRPFGTLLSKLLRKADRIMAGQNHAERKTRGAVLNDSVRP